MVKKEKKKNFEAYLMEIEKIVAEMESGEIDLDGAIKRYEKGMSLIDKCREVLKQSRLKIEKLKKKSENSGEKGTPGEFMEDDGYAVEAEEEEEIKSEDDDDDRDDGKLPF